MDQEGQVVVRWFGAGFEGLHPLLQRLHRQGATLEGPVAVTYGRALGGWLGRRIAARLGIGPGSGDSVLTVRIRSGPDALYWTRTFGNGPEVTSVFTPSGAWPDGCWIEKVGPITLALRVDNTQGEWRWIPVRTRIWGIPLPGWLAPRVDADKCAKDGTYHFSVLVSHALLGTLLSYSGNLARKA